MPGAARSPPRRIQLTPDPTHAGSRSRPIPLMPDPAHAHLGPHSFTAGTLAAVLTCVHRINEAAGRAGWGVLVVGDTPGFISLVRDLPGWRGRVVETSELGDLGHTAFTFGAADEAGSYRAPGSDHAAGSGHVESGRSGSGHVEELGRSGSNRSGSGAAASMHVDQDPDRPPHELREVFAKEEGERQGVPAVARLHPGWTRSVVDLYIAVSRAVISSS